MNWLASANPIDHLIEKHKLFEAPLPHWMWADWGDGGIGLSKPIIYMLFASGLCCLLFIPLAKKWLIVPKGLQGFFEPILLFIRDDIVYDNIADKKLADFFLPFFWTLFFFILFCNLLGLTPHSIAATGQISVTAALATITLCTIVVAGMIVQAREAKAHGKGPVGAWLSYWKNLVPHGVGLAIWPLVFVIEIVGLMAKPFALCIRLFANMTGGHIVILVLLGFAVNMKLLVDPGAYNPAVSGGVTIISILGASLFTGFEIIVGLVQAYVFTLLSAIFIGMAVHPEH